jgi:hypothetical protein
MHAICGSSMQYLGREGTVCTEAVHWMVVTPSGDVEGFRGKVWVGDDLGSMQMAVVETTSWGTLGKSVWLSLGQCVAARSIAHHGHARQQSCQLVSHLARSMSSHKCT